MTEVIQSDVPKDLQLVAVRHYEAGPPPGLELVEPGETFATTKEEEWVSKKKTELTTTRQIETRVKRQVVLEDGKVVEDSGPIVTTNTTEDTEKQEHSQTEVRKLGDDEPDSKAAIENGKPASKEENWVSVPNPDGVVREVKERLVVSREETEELRETEDVHHLGDITDEDFLAAVHSGHPDLREALKDNLLEGRNGAVSTGPRIVHESIKSRKVTDTEDTDAVSSLRPDGKIVTETKRTTEHEEVLDHDLPDNQPDVNKHIENSQRYQKTKDQELIEYIADGVKIGQEMRYKAETMEGERFGEGGEDPHDWDSLSTRMRRARKQQSSSRNHLQKHKGIEDQVGPPMDRKDALTKKPLDFDEEEETRKVETSKWLEHHFGSESRSSKDSMDDEEPTTTKSFFNVTIKSQPTRIETTPTKGYVTSVNTNHRVYHPPSPEPERLTTIKNGYFQGISEWSERKHEDTDRYRTNNHTNGYGDRNHHRESPQRIQTMYRVRDEAEEIIPIPPERKRATERRQRSSQDSNRYDSGYRTHSRNEMSRDSHDEPQDEPPPDYSPPPQRHSPVPSPPPMPAASAKKSYQRTRFAAEVAPKPKHGNIIGQSIRKLVGKIRSASAERKSRRERAKRSPSPQTTYQQYNVIDNIPGSVRRARDAQLVMSERQHQQHLQPPAQRRAASPVQRYYLGEDPFGGSIYGRENKYDGVKPARSATKQRANRRLVHPSDEPARSHSTLGRFSKSTGRLAGAHSADYSRSAQTLPRNIRSEAEQRAPATINVSIINTERPIVNGGPAKPARTYRSSLARSKSFNVHMADGDALHKSNPHLHRLDESPIGLKSPGIVSSVSRSTRDLTADADEPRAARFLKNGHQHHQQQHYYQQQPPDEDAAAASKRTFMRGLRERAPELYRALHSDDDELQARRARHEPPTRLRPADARRAGDDYNETYHVTTRSDDPKRPSVTDTVQSFSKKTIPGRDGRSTQTIESSETKTVTRSRLRAGPFASAPSGAVIIEVKNSRY